MEKYYAGIGSRETPKSVCDEMSQTGLFLFERNYILRSGGAKGADQAFEKYVKTKKEIFLPHKNFEHNKSELYKISEDAYRIAKRIHPKWHRCGQFARNAHGRNVHQVLGKNLQTPIDFLICWTKDGLEIGGTRTAIILAKQNKIPIYNLALNKDRKNLAEFLNAIR